MPIYSREFIGYKMKNSHGERKSPSIDNVPLKNYNKSPLKFHNTLVATLNFGYKN